MTQQHDEISEAQAELDREQGLDATGTQSPVTMEQVNQLVENQLQSLQREVASYRSKVDSGLDAIRRDTKSWAEQQLGDIQSQSNREQFLASLDEEQMAVAKPLLDRIDAVAQQSSQPAAQPSEPPVTGNQDQGGWSKVYSLVKDFGLDPQDPAIEYAALSVPGLTLEMRQKRFTGSLSKAKEIQIIARSKGAPAAQQQKIAAKTSQASSPPLQSGPSGSGATSLKNPEDIRDAYITGKIDVDTYREQITAAESIQ